MAPSGKPRNRESINSHKCFQNMVLLFIYVCDNVWERGGTWLLSYYQKTFCMLIPCVLSLPQSSAPSQFSGGFSSFWNHAHSGVSLLPNFSTATLTAAFFFPVPFSSSSSQHKTSDCPSSPFFGQSFSN